MPASFIDTPECRSGLNCYMCRNNAQFQRIIAARFGRTPTQDECPRRLRFGAKHEEMPKEFHEMQERRKNYLLRMREQRERVMALLDRLAQIGGEAAEIASRIRAEIPAVLGERLVIPPEVAPSCKYMTIDNENQDKPCRGGFIICRNPASPIKDARRVWTRDKCNPFNCKFYEAKNEIHTISDF